MYHKKWNGKIYNDTIGIEFDEDEQTHDAELYRAWLGVISQLLG